MNIDKKSPVPLYHQLEEAIRSDIKSGVLKHDQLIPSEREYASLYGISRMTVRQAINNLVNEGLLYRKKGTGTFVNKQKVEQVLSTLTSFSEDMYERGFTPSSKLLSYDEIPADRTVAEKLQVEEGTPVLRMERLRLADQLPMALEVAFMPIHLTEGLKEEQAKDSLYSFIEDKLSLRIDEAYQELEAEAATDHVAAHLDIEPDSPVLKITRITYLENAVPFEYVRSSFRADRYRFYSTMKR